MQVHSSLAFCLGKKHSSSKMVPFKIPYDQLSPEGLQGVIGEFVIRYGTDYGEIQVPLETLGNEQPYKNSRIVFLIYALDSLCP